MNNNNTQFNQLLSPQNNTTPQFNQPKSPSNNPNEINFNDPLLSQKLDQIKQNPALKQQFQQQLISPDIVEFLQHNPSILNNINGFLEQNPSIKEEIAKFKQQAMQNLAQQVINNIINDEFSAQLEMSQIQTGEGSMFARCCGCLTIEFYQIFFEVDSAIVKQKITCAFNPFSNRFYEIGEGKMDMYGPIWINITLVFCLCSAGNISNFMANGVTQYDFAYLPTAGSLVFAFGLVLPIVICFLMRSFGSDKMGYVNVISIYAYSSVVYLPMILISCIPVAQVQWGMMSYAMLNTTVFLLMNFSQEFNKYVLARKKLILAIIVVFQLILLLAFKFLFFSSILKTTGFLEIGTERTYHLEIGQEGTQQGHHPIHNHQFQTTDH